VSYTIEINTVSSSGKYGHRIIHANSLRTMNFLEFPASRLVVETSSTNGGVVLEEKLNALLRKKGKLKTEALLARTPGEREKIRRWVRQLERDADTEMANIASRQ
jgi:hypothetical protein